LKSFRITSSLYREIIKNLENSKKIAAIKALRTATGAGLKDAKFAIERLDHEKCGGHYSSAVVREGHKIYVGPAIKKITLDYGQGDIIVDLEGMQMMTLMEMQETGLDVCREVLDFIGVLNAYSAGKTIGVIDEDIDRDKQ